MPGFNLSPAARADLEHIWHYTEKHWSKAQAERYARGIQAACIALSNGTKAGWPADDIRPGYRKAAVGSHVMFSRMREDTVEIIRILHQRMDIERHM